MRRRRRIAAGILVLFAAGAGTSTAQPIDPSPVDPDSPSGVEYELPEEGARREASGEPDQRSAKPAPSFGIGIQRVNDAGEDADSGGGPGTAATAEKPAGSEGERTSGSKSQNDRIDGDGGETAGQTTELPAKAAASPSPESVMAIAALAVVLAGVGGGLLLRKRLGRS